MSGTLSSPARPANRYLTVAIPDEWIREIDEIRGETSRSEWVREMLVRAFYRRGITGLPAMTDGRGVWDRLERGKFRPDRAKKEIRRRKRNEYERAWRKAKREQPKPTPLAPKFEFLDDGTVNASDLVQEGMSAGYISRLGRYTKESRHSEKTVFDALCAAMKAEPDREWGERYVRFVERVEHRRGG